MSTGSVDSLELENVVSVRRLENQIETMIRAQLKDISLITKNLQNVRI